jgi:catechol 2,3-dioxygenase-like lactoylglutathione lyase family enzyme
MEDSGRTDHAKLSVVQIGLNTADLPGTLRLYSELFGFANAGANAFWGEPSAIQGLGPDTRGVMWWLVGRQNFFQLELFQHTVPRPKLQAADWTPCDHGWVRFGVAVTDFDRALAVLGRWRIDSLAPVTYINGLRRLGFRDPFVGTIVEILEDGPALLGGVRPRSFNVDPAIVYVTSSVSELEPALRFYEDVVGLEIVDRELLHDPSHEALWGLAGAELDGFAARAGDIFIEVVCYRKPTGRPKDPAYCIADQGIMNIALGSRSVPLVRDALVRIRQAGIRTGVEFGEGEMLAAFALDPGREVEFIALAASLDSAVGFSPNVPFFCAPKI